MTPGIVVSDPRSCSAIEGDSLSNGIDTPRQRILNCDAEPNHACDIAFPVLEPNHRRFDLVTLARCQPRRLQIQRGGSSFSIIERRTYSIPVPRGPRKNLRPVTSHAICFTFSGHCPAA